MKLLLLFNLFTMTLLSFFTSWLLVEAVLLLFRIRSHRFKAFVRMIPIIKVPLDLFFINWSNWALLNGLYPWLAEKDSRMLTVAFKIPHSLFDILLPEFSIIFRMKEHFSFSLADWIYGLMKERAVFYLVLFFCLIFVFSLIVKTKAFLAEWREIRSIITNCENLDVTLFGKMAHLLKKRHISVLKTQMLITSPFTTGLFHKKIIIPGETLSLLSQEELEAVIAHELSHITAKDLFFKMGLICLSTLFAFVPMKRLCKKIFFDQELAADQKALLYGAKKIDLATAIEKHAYMEHRKSFYFGRACFREAARIHSLNNKKPTVIVQSILMALSIYLLMGIFFGKFWFF